MGFSAPSPRSPQKKPSASFLSRLVDRFRRFQAGEPNEEERRELRSLILQSDGELLSSPSLDPFEQPCASEAGRFLLSVWDVAFPAETLNSSKAGDHWRRLGFQSNNPYSDIRAGRLGLQQLSYLAEKYPRKLRRFALESQQYYYPFACTCFNVTQMLVVFFDLRETQSLSPIGGATIANRTEFRSFLSACRDPAAEHAGGELLNELFCVLVEGLHEIWLDMSIRESASLMEFPWALRKLHIAHATFWRDRRIEQPLDFGALATSLQSGGSDGSPSFLRRLLSMSPALCSVVCSVCSVLQLAVEEVSFKIPLQLQDDEMRQPGIASAPSDVSGAGASSSSWDGSPPPTTALGELDVDTLLRRLCPEESSEEDEEEQHLPSKECHSESASPKCGTSPMVASSDLTTCDGSELVGDASWSTERDFLQSAFKEMGSW